MTIIVAKGWAKADDGAIPVVRHQGSITTETAEPVARRVAVS